MAGRTALIKIEMRGIQKTLRRLNNIHKTTRNKIVREASRTGMSVANKTAKRNTPRETGQLKKSIGIKVKTYKRSGTTMAIVGARKGFRSAIATAKLEAKADTLVEDLGEVSRRRLRARQRGQTLSRRALKRVPANYFHLVELGTKRGVKATHFLRNALRGRRRQVLARFIRTLRRGIKRFKFAK